VSQDINLDSWADSLHAWPNPPEGWVAWYNRVARVHQSTWETTGIADALSLSLSPLDKNENLLKMSHPEILISECEPFFLTRNLKFPKRTHLF
jgi:hypothetical protein